MRGAAAALSAVVILTISTQTAFAASIRAGFAGSVDHITGGVRNDPNSGAETPLSPEDAEAALGGSIHQGTRFSGFVIYDDADTPNDGNPETSGPPGFPAYPAWGLYYFDGAQSLVNAEIGSFGGENPGALIMETFDNELYLDGADPSKVMIEAGIAGPPPTGTGPVTLAGFVLVAVGAAPGEPLHSGLVGIPWSIQNFPDSTITWLFTNGITNVRVAGSIDTLPEPAALALLALSACAMILWSWSESFEFPRSHF